MTCPKVGRWTILNREFVEILDGREYSGVLNRNTGDATEWVSKEEAEEASSAFATECKKLYLVFLEE
ncbi:unnamed protein product [Clonostachys byssicola]|uniref:Uncharacterized protein n=1 Tax=Clonostachys byssicola TaxID=160290 RepID=A0A9N9Y186_9HYPO|nr:unnamed protein product [Clonostachys byssicola]